MMTYKYSHFKREIHRRGGVHIQRGEWNIKEVNVSIIKGKIGADHENSIKINRGIQSGRSNLRKNINSLKRKENIATGSGSLILPNQKETLHTTGEKETAGRV